MTEDAYKCRYTVIFSGEIAEQDKHLDCYVVCYDGKPVSKDSHFFLTHDGGKGAWLIRSKHLKRIHRKANAFEAAKRRCDELELKHMRGQNHDDGESVVYP